MDTSKTYLDPEAQDEPKVDVGEANVIGNTETSTTVVTEANALQDSASLIKGYEKELKKIGVLGAICLCAWLSELIKADYKFCNIKSQRPVDIKHVKDLLKSLKQDNATKFSAKGIAVPALTALQKGIELKDADEGFPVTIDSPDVEKYLLIVDMQHRYAACKVGTDIDMEVLITECPDDPEAMVLNHNKEQLGWDSEAFRFHYSQKNGISDTLKEATEEAEKIFSGCSKKAIELALTGKVDVVRKSEMQKGNLPSLSDEQKEIGFNILRTLRVIADSEPKSRRLEVFKAIYNTKEGLKNSIAGSDFGKYLLSWAIEAKESADVKTMVGAISQQDFAGFEKLLTKALKEFIKLHKQNLDAVYQAALENFAKSYPSLATKDLKNASLDVVLKVNAEKEARKAAAKKKQTELEEQLAALRKQVTEQKKAVKGLDYFED